jgi:DNA-binding CsgD family transcriptional regulator
MEDDHSSPPPPQQPVQAVPPLTKTQIVIADMVARGMTNEEVSRTLFLSPRFVEANLGMAMHRLGVARRDEIGPAMTRLRESHGSAD